MVRDRFKLCEAKSSNAAAFAPWRHRPV